MPTPPTREATESMTLQKAVSIVRHLVDEYDAFTRLKEVLEAAAVAQHFLDGHGAQLAALRAEMTALREQLPALRAQHTELTAAVAAEQGRLAAVRAELAALKTALA